MAHDKLLKGQWPYQRYWCIRPCLGFIHHKRASLACTARLEGTMCPPEMPFGLVPRKNTKFVNFKNFDA